MKKCDWYDDYMIYICYYKDKAYIAGYDKKLVRKYMEKYRKLNRDEYRLERCIPSNLQLLMLEPVMLEHYEGFYLANRDVLLINIFESKIDSKLKRLYQDTYDVCKLVGQLDDSDKYTKKLIDSCKVLTKIYYDRKLLKKLNKIAIASNPLIYCDMKTYDEMIHQYSDYIDYEFHMRSITGNEFIRI